MAERMTDRQLETARIAASHEVDQLLDEIDALKDELREAREALRDSRGDAFSDEFRPEPDEG